MNRLIAILSALALFATMLSAPLARAQTGGVVTLEIGKSELLKLPSPVGTVFVADPSIADVQVGGPNAIFLFGVSTGQTTFFALDAEGNTLARREIRVSHDISALRGILATRFPNTRLRLNTAPNSIMVEGVVDTPAEADAIAQTIAGVVGENENVINRIEVAAPVQVNLRVRVAEVSRNVDQRLGFNWQSILDIGDFTFGIFTGAGFSSAIGGIVGPSDSFGGYTGSYSDGNVDINGLIDALDREGLARTLAEPNLTAMSGETASFTAGGEFPVPVAQENNTITIEFKPFGVLLDFVPTVLSPDRISLRVRPEVSDLTDEGAILLDNVVIPALTVRRVETTVELASGQSLVIGGLLQQTTRDAIDKLPGLGDVPVLGALFTSTRYQNDETELLITVTPYVVRPTRPDALGGPIAPPAPGRSLEALLLERSARRHGFRGPPRLNGPVGFIY